MELQWGDDRGEIFVAVEEEDTIEVFENKMIFENRI